MVYGPHKIKTTTQKMSCLWFCESSFTNECVPSFTDLK